MADKTITVSLPEVNAQNKPSGGDYPKQLGVIPYRRPGWD